MKKITLQIDHLLNLAHTVSAQAIAGEGNVSARDGKGFLIKASGTSLDTLTYDDLVRCQLSGKPIAPDELKPSMEVSFHAWFYRTFPEIDFVCHTHPTNTVKILCSSRFSTFGSQRMFPDQVVRNGARSCMVPYATPGPLLKDAIDIHLNEFIKRENRFPKLILLQNHGIITASASAKECAISALMCEKSAEIYIGAKLLNNVSFLSPEAVADIDTNPNEEYRRKLYQ